ncbi:transposase domain-containing protein, partial [Pseudomonas aeruginosa]|uniref:transposase domain-containing protein n=1 Tax=Pseudomonas aeruginosa TaxID=287 RepID=UPI00387E7A33
DSFCHTSGRMRISWIRPCSRLLPSVSAVMWRKAALFWLMGGFLLVDNNWIENQIRPWALGRANWLFAGSLRSGQRGAALMTLIQSARLNGHDPYAYLKDVLTRPPT